MNLRNLILFFFIISTINSAQNSRTELHKRLLEIPGIEVNVLEPDSHFTEAYEIFLTQPVDHLNPNNGPKFTQRIYLRHTDFNQPMIMNNEGYATNSKRRTELAKIIKCNEMFVEHRYFGESKPDTSLGWKYLTTAQSAADHKRIVDLFKRIYTGKWVSTGISKGGQTSIFFKYYYPEAVDMWVPYVAPLNLAQEDERLLEFFNNVGTEECRNKIIDFQRAVLENRDDIIPLLEERMNEKNYNFTLGLEKTLEYAVFEYSFAFWQWGNLSCEDIPSTNSSPDSLLKHLYTVYSLSYFDSAASSYYLPFYYQAYTEIGYYGYETEDFSDLLVEVKEPIASSIFFAPKDAELKYNDGLMIDVHDFIKNHGTNMLFIYGENDAWSATAAEISPETNAVKMVKEDGNHRTRIHSFEGEELEKIYSTLEDWLDVKISR